MAFPFIFNTLTAGNIPGSTLDTNFVAAGNMGSYSCTASGVNTITLTLGANQPAVAAYFDFLQVRFSAQNTPSGSVNILISGLPAVNLYNGNGVQAGPGDISAGLVHTAVYLSSLNGGSGGFQLLGTPATGALTAITSINGGQLAGFRNQVINGDMYFNQRFGATGSVTNATSSYVYALDRWRFFGQAGGTGSGIVSQVAFTPGQTDVPGEPQYYLRWQQTVAATGTVVLSQPIEDVRKFAGQPCVISFYTKTTTGTANITTRLEQNFGSGGSTSVDSATQVNALTSTWQKFTMPLTPASISGKTIGTSNFLDLQFLNTSISTFDVQVSRVQIEPGSYATPFEVRNYATELAMCQRYYEKSFLPETAPTTNAGLFNNYYGSMVVAGAVGRFWTTFKATKRVNPTGTILNPSAANNNIRNGTLATDYSSCSIQSTTNMGLMAIGTAPTSTIAGNTAVYEFTADAEF